MEEDEDWKRVLSQTDAPEEPRLREDEGDDAVVHRVAGESIQTSDNKEAWGIDRGESALACVEEVPDAPEEDKSTGDGEDGGADGGEPEVWDAQ